MRCGRRKTPIFVRTGYVRELLFPLGADLADG
jgi:hypothetical protein